LSKGLGRGSEVKALARGVVVGGDEASKAAVWQGCQIGLAGEEAAHAADGILDAALLPGRIGITEEGLDLEFVQRQVTSELGAVVEGDGLTQRIRQGSEQTQEMVGDASGSLAGETDSQQHARGALVHGQDGLAIF
jgi:hypothetical protein